jgi:hypothetical protein
MLRARWPRPLATILVLALALAALLGQQAVDAIPRVAAHLFPPTPPPSAGRAAAGIVVSTVLPAPDLRSRPLHLPALAPGEACPVTQPHAADPDVGQVTGDGPFYAEFDSDGTLRYAPAAAFNSREWGGQTMIWVAPPTLAGHILLRGRQLDGPDEVRFGGGDVPAIDHLVNSPHDAAHVGNAPWLTFIDTARLEAPGCYAYQIDSAWFSTVVVFRAVPLS